MAMALPSAYELHIGTDCNSVSVDDYIGSVAPVADATITVPDLPPYDSSESFYVVRVSAHTHRLIQVLRVSQLTLWTHL